MPLSLDATRAAGLVAMQLFVPEMGQPYASGRNFDHRYGQSYIGIGSFTLHISQTDYRARSCFIGTYGSWI